MRFRFTLATVCTVITLASAQNITWSRLVGDANDDEVYSVTRTVDGGCAVFGTMTRSYVGCPAVVKFSGTGVVEWTRVLGQSMLDLTVKPYAIAQAADSSFYLVGTVGFSSRMYICHLSAHGDSLWTRKFILDATGVISGCGVAASSGGGCIAIGSTMIPPAQQGTGIAVKFSATGDTVWSRYLGSSIGCLAIKPITSLTYIISGISTSNVDVTFLGKISDDGTIAWQRSFPLPVGATSTPGMDVTVTSDGNFAVCGLVNNDSTNFNSCADYFATKVDTGGTVLFNKKIHPLIGGHYCSIAPATNGGVVLFGDAKASALSLQRICMAKLGPAGDSIWIRWLNDTLNTGGIGRSIVSDGGSGFYCTGPLGIPATGSTFVTSNDMFVARTDSAGNFANQNSITRPVTRFTTSKTRITMNSQMIIFETPGKEDGVVKVFSPDGRRLAEIPFTRGRAALPRNVSQAGVLIFSIIINSTVNETGMLCTTRK